MLMDGLKAKNLHDCVNIIVASDHGEINTNSPQLGYSLYGMTETENYQFTETEIHFKRNETLSYFQLADGLISNGNTEND